MNMSNTPKANRVHIGIFGKRNAGKSSLINALIGQELAIVSDQKGTTTDPVYKAMELLPLGPVVWIDTPGLDDEGELGEKRIRKSLGVLNKADIALLVVDDQSGMDMHEENLLSRIKEKEIPYLVVRNKADLSKQVAKHASEYEISVSAVTGQNIHTLKQRIAKMASAEIETPIISDLVQINDVVVLVVPIDKAAPKGRLILPQQQTIRELLDSGAIAVVTRDTELQQTMECLEGRVKLVVTDSQAFGFVSETLTPEVPLTSFSILFARHKGILKESLRAIQTIDTLKDGDAVLICEGCTHHRQCDDIGTVKIPKWLADYTGKKLNYSFASGGDFPDDLSVFRLIVHCGGCMLNPREVQNRLRQAVKAGIPMTNYGMLIAHLNGILKRSLEPFRQFGYSV